MSWEDRVNAVLTEHLGEQLPMMSLGDREKLALSLYEAVVDDFRRHKPGIIKVMRCERGVLLSKTRSFYTFVDRLGIKLSMALRLDQIKVNQLYALLVLPVEERDRLRRIEEL